MSAEADFKAELAAEYAVLEPIALALRDKIKLMTPIGGANEYDLARVVRGLMDAETEDLRSRLACVVEATYWDRPYDERIAAVRGMCDLAQSGLKPGPTDDDLVAAALREAARDYREHIHDEHDDVTPVGQGIVIPTGDDVVRAHAERACRWLEQRADLMGADRG